ncbi:MAG: hypothetical protein E4H11_00955 [Myxococcales bacterium]|nr:MAG: hypothetical protein E4H11_00955 [Myxococcales bacterium]
MTKMRTIVRTSGIGAVFASGYLCGALLQPAPAEAQIGDLMKQAGDAAGGGALGTAMKLGTSITDMQKNVDDLQKNIEILKEVKTAIGG